jgi:hypothetical protein
MEGKETKRGKQTLPSEGLSDEKVAQGGEWSKDFTSAESFSFASQLNPPKVPKSEINSVNFQQP